MKPLPALTHSHRAALLGGVSLIALQGMSACSTTTPVTPSTGYTPQVNTPYVPPLPDSYIAQDGTVYGGGVSQGSIYGDGMATTLAVGEEDGSGPIPVEPDGGIGDGAGPPPFATTLAIGEEDGGYGQPVDPGFATTLAIGEEDGGYGQPVDQGTVTTLAIGEEDGGYGQPVDPGFATTLALGEEDGSFGSYEPPAFDVTTQAIGEEG